MEAFLFWSHNTSFKKKGGKLERKLKREAIAFETSKVLIWISTIFVI